MTWLGYETTREHITLIVHGKCLDFDLITLAVGSSLGDKMFVEPAVSHCGEMLSPDPEEGDSSSFTWVA